MSIADAYDTIDRELAYEHLSWRLKHPILWRLRHPVRAVRMVLRIR